MFAINPFSALSPAVSPGVMQAYLVIMIILVAAGTLFDIVHKGSAKYFFNNFKKSKGKPVGGGELVAIGVKTAVVDVLASGEFCNAKRRIAHLLTMYGFVLHVVSTVVMVFNLSADSMWAHLWWIGGLMVLVGGYWFWFFIRVDVAAEGSSPFRVMHADLFILSLLASVTLGLLWAWLGGGTGAVRALHPRHDGAVRRSAVVQVRAHVLQARRGVREAGVRGQRHARESADADA